MTEKTAQEKQPTSLEPEQYTMLGYFAPMTVEELRDGIDNDRSILEAIKSRYPPETLEIFKVGCRMYAKRHPKEYELVKSDPVQAARNLIDWLKALEFRLDLVEEFERNPVMASDLMRQVGGQSSPEVRKSTSERGVNWLARQLREIYEWAFEGEESQPK